MERILITYKESEGSFLLSVIAGDKIKSYTEKSEKTDEIVALLKQIKEIA